LLAYPTVFSLGCAEGAQRRIVVTYWGPQMLRCETELARRVELNFFRTTGSKEHALVVAA